MPALSTLNDEPGFKRLNRVFRVVYKKMVYFYTIVLYTFELH